MLCTKCGQAIEAGVPFCTNCGTPAPQAFAAPPPPPGFTPPPPSFTPPPPGFQQAPPTYPAMAGYGPGWQPPQAPPPAGRSRTGLIVGSVVAAVVLLGGLGVGLYFGLRGDDSNNTTSSKSTVTSSSTGSSTGSSASTSTTEEVFAQKEGEIFLEPVGTAGPDSFGGETFVPAVPAATPHIFTTTSLGAGATTTAPGGATTTTPAVTTTTAGGGVQVVSYGGDTPALYGGSKDKQLVDKEGQLTFFENNPDKAAAFCAALNSDPTFKWSGGTQIEPSQLRAYFAELTPMMLTRDTRVTNNGYRNGKPTPRQSVLQKGQMVLVDQYGVPRVRCECGNPLSPPKPVQKTPTYTGPQWPDFDPATIIVVQPTTIVINIFVVVDIDTGDPFDRPAGTEGTDDVAHGITVWQLDVEMVWDDAENQHHFTVNWTGAVTLNTDDDSLSGEGAGQWHVDGACWEGDTVNGYMTGDGFFSVELTGQLDDSDSGKILTIFPAMTDFSIDGSTWDPPTGLEQAQADFEASIESLIVSSFTTSLPIAPTNDEPVVIELGADEWAGSATLAPYEP